MVDELVLVTGGTGYIAAFCIATLLDEGYVVRTTVRSLASAEQVRERVRRAAGSETEPLLDFVEADLLSDAGWAEAVENCVFVLHVASPFPVRQPKDPEIVIRPAVEGTLRVLTFARNAGVRRVVMTSSAAAATYGPLPIGRLLDETDWSDPAQPEISAYAQSKTLAEQAAWQFVADEGEGMELTTVLPVGVVGPVIGEPVNGTMDLLTQILQGRLPGMPDVEVGFVDVRDVADLEVLAMTHPKAEGQRFLASSGPAIRGKDLGTLLQAIPGGAMRKVPVTLPDWVMRLVAMLQPQFHEVVPFLKRPMSVSNEKAVNLLGWRPRSVEDTIRQAAESLIANGYVLRHHDRAPA